MAEDCHGRRQPSWTSLDFQGRVVAELLQSAIAEEFPPRGEYVSRFIKVPQRQPRLAAGTRPCTSFTTKQRETPAFF